MDVVGLLPGQEISEVISNTWAMQPTDGADSKPRRADTTPPPCFDGARPQVVTRRDLITCDP